MAKPTNTYQFATNADAISDPGPTRKATGFIPGTRLPAKWLNYLLNGYGKWTAYVNELHDEPEFLNKAYAWTAAHTFAATLAVAGTVTAQDYLTTGFIPRVVFVPPSAFTPVNGQWSFVDLESSTLVPPGVYWLATGGTANARLTGTVRMPHLSRVQRVRALIYTPGLRMVVTRLFYNKETGDVIRTVLSDTTATAPGYLDTGVLASPVEFSGPDDLLGIQFTTTSTNPDPSRVTWVELTYLDPGPRNY